MVDRTLDDLSDTEVILRQTDEAWFADFCLEQLGRLPSEVAPTITMRECTLIQARGIVKQAQGEMVRLFAGHEVPKL